MSRSFSGSADSTATVDEILAAFGRKDYWVARLATGDAVTTLDSLVAHADGTVSVHFTQYLGRQLLPAMVARLLPGDLTMEYAETWTPEDARVRGQIDAVASGGLGSCGATASLTPIATGSQLRFDGSVKVKIPLVGGNLEKSIGADLARNMPSVLRFTTTWIEEQA